MEITFNKFGKVDIPFNSEWKDIAISLSGGCDSALLLYQLCTLINDTTVHVITNTRNWKTRPWQGFYSKRVYDYFVNKFPNIKFVRHTNYIPPELESLIVRTDEFGVQKTGNQVTTRSFAEYVCINNNVIAYYAGDTSNPPDVSGGPVDRELNGPALMPIREHLNGYAFQPYSNVHKDYIVSEYKRLNIMELFDLTRSCEGDFDDLDYTNYIEGQDVPECKTCFWCREREWGINNA